MANQSVTLDLLMRTSSFETDTARAERRVKKMEKEFAAASRAIAGVFAPIGAAMAGAFSIGALVNFSRQALNGIDALNDLADAAGTTVENASALEDVARRAGGSLEDVSGILIKFNQVLAAAKPGSGADEVLKQIGLNAEELKRIDPAEALRQTAVALSRFADDGNKARAIQELFGKSVREAAPFLKDLAAQGRLVATVTSEQAEQAERFNKTLAEMETNFSTLSRGVVMPFAEAFNRLAESIKKSEKAGDSFYAKMTKAQWSFLGNPFGLGMPSNTGGATASWGNPDLPSIGAGETEQQKALRLFFEQNATAAERFTAELAKQKAALGDLFSPEVEKRLRARFFPAKAPKVERLGMEAETDPLDAFRRSELEATDAVNRALESSKWDDWAAKRTESLKAAATAQDRLNALIADTPTGQLEKQRETMQFLAAAFERGTITADQFSEAANAALGNMAAEAEKANDFASRLGLTFSSAFEDAVIAGDKFSDVLKGLAQDVLRLVVRKQVTEPFAKAINGIDFGSLFGGLLAGKRAMGGPVTAGQTYLVGERGKELFTPNTSGRILPNSALGGGGTTVVIENHGAQITERRSRGSDGREEVRFIVQAAVAEVDRRISAGGSTAAALKGRGVNLSGALPRRA